MATTARGARLIYLAWFVDTRGKLLIPSSDGMHIAHTVSGLCLV